MSDHNDSRELQLELVVLEKPKKTFDDLVKSIITKLDIIELRLPERKSKKTGT